MPQDYNFWVYIVTNEHGRRARRHCTGKAAQEMVAIKESGIDRHVESTLD